MRKVGILGGMGPAATILLQQRLLQAVNAADDSSHLPLLIDMNPQVPSRIAHLLEGRTQDPGPVLADMAYRLEAMGAQALAMPCNTAHYYAPQIEEAVSIPLLNMIELTADQVARRLGAGCKVGLLASPAVRNIGLFSKLLKAMGWVEIWPENGMPLLAAIREIKHHGPTEQSRAALKKASQDLFEREARLQIIACSEFSIIADSIYREVQAVDTMDVLAEAICAFAQNR